MSRVVIAGSRSITNLSWLEHAIVRSGFDITEVISGKEPNGVDHLGELWAIANGIPVDLHPAEWSKYDLAAGPIRNTDMADIADAAIILRVPLKFRSNGSDDMYQKMLDRNKPVHREIWGERK